MLKRIAGVLVVVMALIGVPIAFSQIEQPQTISKVDQLTIAPSANTFSATGTNVFSVSSEYCAQLARGTWNWVPDSRRDFLARITHYHSK